MSCRQHSCFGRGEAKHLFCAEQEHREIKLSVVPNGTAGVYLREHFFISTCFAQLKVTREVLMPQSAIVSVQRLDAAAQIATVLIESMKLLVRHPDRVLMDARTTADQVSFLVRVAPEDLGCVLGKQGRTVRSLRALLYSMAQNSEIRIEFDVRAEGL
jgi:predicted RNA-binding protein YlqC (UPF0109 family)